MTQSSDIIITVSDAFEELEGDITTLQATCDAKGVLIDHIISIIEGQRDTERNAALSTIDPLVRVEYELRARLMDTVLEEVQRAYDAGTD